MRVSRRFAEQTKVGNPVSISFEEARTRFPSRVRSIDSKPLKPGANNKKLGSIVAKGEWKGMAIYSLSLEERATCPRSCKVWNTCYGNQMPFALRMKWSPSMKKALLKQIDDLSKKHKKGFVIRLHVLGDFIDHEYAYMWMNLSQKYHNMRVFGYTARKWSFLHEYAFNNWDRFAIRLSGSDSPRGSYVTPVSSGPGITCPAQTGKTECCGTCSLCWATQKPINFLEH